MILKLCTEAKQVALSTTLRTSIRVRCRHVLIYKGRYTCNMNTSSRRCLTQMTLHESNLENAILIVGWWSGCCGKKTFGSGDESSCSKLIVWLVERIVFKKEGIRFRWWLLHGGRILKCWNWNEGWVRKLDVGIFEFSHSTRVVNLHNVPLMSWKLAFQKEQVAG